MNTKKDIIKKEWGYVFMVENINRGQSLMRIVKNKEHDLMTTEEKFSILVDLEEELNSSTSHDCY